jgi:elongation factor G
MRQDNHYREILYYTGINYKIGEVHEGTATMDWMVQERNADYNYIGGDDLFVARSSCQYYRHSATLIYHRSGAFLGCLTGR